MLDLQMKSGLEFHEVQGALEGRRWAKILRRNRKDVFVQTRRTVTVKVLNERNNQARLYLSQMLSMRPKVLEAPGVLEDQLLLVSHIPGSLVNLALQEGLEGPPPTHLLGPGEQNKRHL